MSETNYSAEIPKQPTSLNKEWQSLTGEAQEVANWKLEQEDAQVPYGLAENPNDIELIDA